VLFLDDEFQVLIAAFYNGDIPCIQKLLKVSHISLNSRIYTESGSSFPLLLTATIAQQIDIVKLLMTSYFVDPYCVSSDSRRPWSYFHNILFYAPQSFIIEIWKYCGVKTDFKSDGLSLLHVAVITNCFDAVHFLLEECSDVDVNITDDDNLLTPLHMAYGYGHTQIAQYLIQHGADGYAVDGDGHTPYEYIDGDPDLVKDSEYFQNKRKIHHIPFSLEHCYYMKLNNLGYDDKEAVSLTMEQFPLLKEDGPTQPHHDIDHASALKEFIYYITNTKRSKDEQMRQPSSSEVQREDIKKISDYPRRRGLSLAKKANAFISRLRERLRTNIRRYF